MKALTQYFVVEAPGRYGDSGTVVVGAYTTYQEAERNAGKGWVVRYGFKNKGDRFLKDDERFSPVVTIAIET